MSYQWASIVPTCFTEGSMATSMWSAWSTSLQSTHLPGMIPIAIHASSCFVSRLSAWLLRCKHERAKINKNNQTKIRKAKDRKGAFQSRPRKRMFSSLDHLLQFQSNWGRWKYIKALTKMDILKVQSAAFAVDGAARESAVHSPDRKTAGMKGWGPKDHVRGWFCTIGNWFPMFLMFLGFLARDSKMFARKQRAVSVCSSAFPRTKPLSRTGFAVDLLWSLHVDGPIVGIN